MIKFERYALITWRALAARAWVDQRLQRALELMHVLGVAMFQVIGDRGVHRLRLLKDLLPDRVRFVRGGHAIDRFISLGGCIDG